MSGKTTYLLKGRDAGLSKTAKAEKLGTTLLDEDAFYGLFDSSEAQPVQEPELSKKTTTNAKGKASATTNKSKIKTESTQSM